MLITKTTVGVFTLLALIGVWVGVFFGIAADAIKIGSGDSRYEYAQKLINIAYAVASISAVLAAFLVYKGMMILHKKDSGDE